MCKLFTKRWVFYTAAFFGFWMIQINQITATEIEVSSKLPDESLGFTIYLPSLICHVKHMDYKEVRWYKDDILVKCGGFKFFDHTLSLKSLLEKNSSDFENVLKLQGYYWCETDSLTYTIKHRFLFKIKEVNTYVGKLLATEDYIEQDKTSSIAEKVSWKKEMYETEMTENLFVFLPAPNTYVTKIKKHPRGLSIHFYLYARDLLMRRQIFEEELVKDQHELIHILEYLNNETIMDPALYEYMLNWTISKGIEIKNITIRSTLGCYEEDELIASEPPHVIRWPFAKIGEIVIPEEACSSKNGLAVTRMCTGSFRSGAAWGRPSDRCDLPADGFTRDLKDLYDMFGSIPRSMYVEMLQNITYFSKELKVTDIHIVLKLLKELSEIPDLKDKEIHGIFSIISSFLHANESELISAKGTIRLTNRIITIIDNIMKMAAETDKEISVSNQNLLVKTKDTELINETDHILGFAVISSKRSSLTNSSIEFLTNHGKGYPKKDSIAYFVLPNDLILSREVSKAFSCQIEVVFFRQWNLFPDPKHLLTKRNFQVLPTPVIYVSISGGPAWNLTDPVRLYFKDMDEVKVEYPVCVHYDSRLENGDGGWSTEGCEYKGFGDGYHKCECHHLSVFALALSQNPVSYGFHALGTAVYVGGAASILALCFAIVLFTLSKMWRTAADHMILFCLALSLMNCLLLILFNDLWHSHCMILALLLHYTIFAALGWLLIHAIVYQLRFARKTDVLEIPHFKLKSNLSVWGVPVIIVFIMWIIRDHDENDKESCLYLVSDVAWVSVIPVVFLMFVILCVNSCAAYALSCRYRRDYLVNDKNYNETIVKFRVAFSIYLCFVASWLFGFFALQKKSKDLRVLFALCITLTSYYVTLFFVFHEISFWDLCKKCKKGKKDEIKGVKYDVRKYDATNEGFEPEPK